MNSNKDALLNQIQRLKDTMYEAIAEKDSDLTNSKVVSISQQLDEIITKYTNLINEIVNK